MNAQDTGGAPRSSAARTGAEVQDARARKIRDEAVVVRPQEALDGFFDGLPIGCLELNNQVETAPQRRVDDLVLREQPVERAGEAERAERAREREMFGCLEVEQRIVEVEQEQPVFHGS